MLIAASVHRCCAIRQDLLWYFVALLVLMFVSWNSAAQEPPLSPPQALLKAWKPTTDRKLPGDCASRSRRLASQLASEQDCKIWQQRWLVEMECAVDAGLLPEIVGYCFEYNNDTDGARRFYRQLVDQHANARCDHEGYDHAAVPCSHTATVLIERLSRNFKEFPSDPAAMVEEMLAVLRSGDRSGILRYFYPDAEICYEPGACERLSELAGRHGKNPFPVLYAGRQREDHLNNARFTGTTPLPCVASGPWGRWGTLSFDVIALPERKGQPRRYRFDVMHGGNCVRQDKPAGALR